MLQQTMQVKPMSLLQVSGISRQEAGVYLLNGISFTQQPFQKLAIAGATGSGKTTLLKIIAGLVQPNAGTVLFEGEKIKGPEEKLMAGHSGIAYLSQHFELLNHYRVEEILQMANGLRKEEAEVINEVCQIDHLLKRWTHQLSGGERQRIALARLLVSAPKLLLLDEPYSNLDAIHKSLLKSVIDAVGEKIGLTCILVSHDGADTLSWADEILVLQNGQIIQKGAPVDVYQQPVSEYAAALFGKYTIMDPALAKAFSAFADMEMNSINAFFRPEQFQIVLDETKGLKGEVQRVRFKGSYYEMEIAISGTEIIVNTNDGSFKKEDVVYVSLV